jgi:hypothetical protein
VRGRIALLLLLFLAESCHDGVAPPDHTDIALIRVTPEAAAVFVGDTVHLEAEATLFDGTTLHQPSLTWSTSDPNVATIDPSGKLTALASGTVTVTAVSEGVEGIAEAQVNPIGRADTRLQGSPEFTHQEEPHLVIDEAGNLYAAWKETTEPGAADRVAYSSSADDGLTWSDSRLMGPMAPGWLQSDPWLALDESGTLFFARLEVCLDFDGWTVVVSASEDGGLTWDRTVAVADSVRLDKETLYSDGAGFLYAAYLQVPTLRVARSQDGGRTWSTASLLPTPAEGPTGPVLAPRPDGYVFAAWWSRPDDNLWVAASSDRGVTWSGLQRLNPEAESLPFLGPWPAIPTIAAGAGGRVTVAWQDYASGDWDILLAHTDDDGETWSPPLRINDSPLGDQFMPALAAGPDGSLHAAWYDSRTGNVNLVYARSDDGGETWSTNVRVTSEETPIFHRRLGDYLGLAVRSDGEAFMVWTDWRGSEQNIYFARSSDF